MRLMLKPCGRTLIHYVPYLLASSWQASGNLHIENGWKDVGQTAMAFVSNNIWRAPIAACALGGLMVVLFNLMSCLVMVR